MAFLVVSGITVPVTPSGANRSTEEIGDRARAFDGTMRQTVLATKRSWSATTAPLSQANADTLYNALLSTTLPLVCSGDFLGATRNCFATVDDWNYVKTAVGYLIVGSFTLYEQ